MAGGQEGTATMSIFYSDLRSGKNQWSKPRLISQTPDCSEQNPLLFTGEGDHVHLIHTAQQSRSSEDTSWRSLNSSFSMQWTAVLRTQTRSIGGRRWSTASDLFPENAFCRNPPYRRLDGSFLLPIYRSLEEGGGFGHDFSEVLLLNPDGTYSGTSYPVPASTGRVHGSIVLSSDGSQLLQFFRSRLADHIYLSLGTPDGSLWTEPVPTSLPNNNSSIQSFRLASGRLAIIYNHFCFEPDPLNPQAWGEANWPRTRWPLTVALSEDDGISWPWARNIDAGFGFAGLHNWQLNGQLAYPTLLEGQPGELHIAYSWAGRSSIRYVCLNESDIIGYEPSEL